MVITDVYILCNMKPVDVSISKSQTTTVLNKWAYTHLSIDIQIYPSKSRMYPKCVFALLYNVFWKILIVIKLVIDG